MNDSFSEPKQNVQDGHTHVPPYEQQRYAHYAPEPWDETGGPASETPRVWYFFLVYTIGVMLMGTLFVFLGLFCHFNPQAMLDAQAQSSMSPTFADINEVKNAAVIYWAMGGLYLLGGAMVFYIPRNMLLWGYGIALMFLATLSFCFAPFSIAMFIFWMLPSSRAYFQK